MKDWFKARNVWGAAISALSDAEAGRLAKAIWAYTMDGEIQTIEGAGKGILAMILMTLSQDDERDSDISAKRSNAARSMHMQANANKCMQMHANADNKNKNKSQNKEQEPETESEFISDGEAQQIVSEQNEVLDAAESAGFARSETMRSKLIDLYAIHGKDKLLAAMDECVIHGVTNIAYLSAVLKGEPKKQKKLAVVPAQDYEQRDNSGDTEAAIERMMSGWSK